MTNCKWMILIVNDNAKEWCFVSHQPRTIILFLQILNLWMKICIMRNATFFYSSSSVDIFHVNNIFFGIKLKMRKKNDCFKMPPKLREHTDENCNNKVGCDLTKWQSSCEYQQISSGDGVFNMCSWKAFIIWCWMALTTYFVFFFFS